MFSNESVEFSLFLLCFTILVAYLWWYRRPKNFPPGPRGLPFLGNVFTLRKYPERTAYKLSKKYGPIVSIRVGREDWVFLNNFDSINQALVKHGHSFSGRPQMPVFSDFTEGPGIGLIEGEFWKAQRRFGLMTLRGFGVGRKGMEQTCIEEVAYLNEAIRSENGKAFDISSVLHNAVSNIICGVTFGRRYDYNDKEFSRILHLIVNLFDDPVKNIGRAVMIYAPMLKYIPPFSFICANLRRLYNEVGVFLRKTIKEHEDSFDAENIRDFIDAFLQERQATNNHDFSEPQLTQYIRDLFFAGTETTASTLQWSLLCLLHYPDKQKKVRNEILQVLDSSGQITMSKKTEMPYTSAFIQEVMRYRTLAATAIPHKVTEDTEICGYFIPKDTRIIANLWAVHNDTDYWKEPEKFKPERFIDEKGNFIKSNHVIPFSVGPRFCLGEQLARMEVFIFLMGMMQKFEFFPDPDESILPDIQETSGFIHVPKHFKIVAKECEL